MLHVPEPLLPQVNSSALFFALLISALPMRPGKTDAVKEATIPPLFPER